MRPLRALAFYLLLIFIGAALLAPVLYWLAQAVAGWGPVWEKLAGQRFDRFVTRSMLILALAGLWPLLHSLSIRSWGDLGWVKPQGQGANFLRGFLLGLISLGLATLMSFFHGVTPQVESAQLGRHVVNAGTAALAVAALEETLFRGGILGGLRRVCGWGPALAISSALYAAVHFFAKAPVAGEVHWTTGFKVLAQMFQRFGDGQEIFPKFFCLALAGVILGWVYMRTGSLYASIGLHAGWIFCLKFYRHFFAQMPGKHDWFWGSHELVDGGLALVVLIGCLPLIPLLFPGAGEKTQSPC